MKHKIADIKAASKEDDLFKSSLSKMHDISSDFARFQVGIMKKESEKMNEKRSKEIQDRIDEVEKKRAEKMKQFEAEYNNEILIVSKR